MHYFVGTYRGETVWFDETQKLSCDISDVKPAPNAVANAARSIVAQLQNGSVLANTIEQMNHAIKGYKVEAS